MSYYATLSKKTLVILGLLLLPVLSQAYTAEQPLKTQEAFQLNASIGDDQTIMLHWQIADNYYLYREKLAFSIEQPKDARLGRVLLPQGQPRIDQFLGKHHVYANQLTIGVPIIEIQTNDTVTLLVHYQGCSASGYCYPPMQKRFNIHFATHKIISEIDKESVAIQSNKAQTQAEKLLQTHHGINIIFGFLLLGLLLSLTPCVLPMVPIVSSIIVGHQKNLTALKGFLLSLTYVLSMAATYAAAGVVAAYLGTSLQALLQTPWIIFAMALLFVLLALAFFGVFRLNLSNSFTEKIIALSQKQKGGTYLSVAIMGILATFILSPCVTPALVGVLTYIAQTGSPWLGGSALFLMGLGMGAPLLLIGIAGGKLLPKAGQWMSVINQIFGIMMLIVAIWLLSRILPGQMILFLYAALAIITGIGMGALNFHLNNYRDRLLQGVGFLLLLYGSVLVVGASQGNTQLLHPLSQSTELSTSERLHTTALLKNTQPAFILVKSVQDADQILSAAAKTPSKPFLIDFYANWCITCQALDTHIFKNPEMIEPLSHFTLLRVDITDQTPDQRLLQKRFHVIAPPAIVFFDQHGQRIRGATITGNISKTDMKKHLTWILHTLSAANES